MLAKFFHLKEGSIDGALIFFSEQPFASRIKDSKEIMQISFIDCNNNESENGRNREVLFNRGFETFS